MSSRSRISPASGSGMVAGSVPNRRLRLPLSWRSIRSRLMTVMRDSGWACPSHSVGRHHRRGDAHCRRATPQPAGMVGNGIVLAQAPRSTAAAIGVMGHAMAAVAETLLRPQRLGRNGRRGTCRDRLCRLSPSRRSAPSPRMHRGDLRTRPRPSGPRRPPDGARSCRRCLLHQVLMHVRGADVCVARAGTGIVGVRRPVTTG